MSGLYEGRAAANATPFMLNAANGASSIKRRLADDARPRAIVADEYEFDRSAISRILRREFNFAAVSQATSFEDLVQLPAGGQATLVVVNLDLLGAARLTRLRMLRNHYPRARLAVISHHGSWDMVRLALSAGAHGYIPLQLKVDEFCSALGVILSGNIFAPFRTVPRTAPHPDEREVSLTPRQWQVMKLVAEGLSDKDIARQLGVAPSTIKTHVSAVFRVLRVHNRVRAAQAFLRATPAGDPQEPTPLHAIPPAMTLQPIPEPAG